MQLVHVHSTNTYLSDYENKSKLFLMVIIYTCRVPPPPSKTGWSSGAPQDSVFGSPPFSQSRLLPPIQVQPGSDVYEGAIAFSVQARSVL